MTKTSISHDSIEQFLSGKYGAAYKVESLMQLEEGLESQAFKFSAGAKALVLRLNEDEAGFQKDLLCYRTYAQRLPIPEIMDIGQFDDATAYCVSQWVSGKTLQALTDAELEPYLQPTFDLLLDIRKQSISEIKGFGAFNSRFETEFATWDAFLGSVMLPEKAQYREIYAAYQGLLPFCSERRELVHGDFGSNNVLVANGQISAIIDWDCGKIGDYLMDVASAYFWSYHLNCMKRQAEFYEAHLAQFEADYHERIRCYQLMLGLSLLHEYEDEPDIHAFILPRLDEIMSRAS